MLLELKCLLVHQLTLLAPYYRLHLSSALFFFTSVIERSLYLKLKEGMANSIDPDEMAHCVSARTMVFAKAYYYCLWQ